MGDSSCSSTQEGQDSGTVPLTCKVLFALDPGFLGVPCAGAELFPSTLQALPGRSLSPPAGRADHEIGDDISGMGLAAALIAGWRDGIGSPAPLMQGRQRDADCERAAASVPRTSA